MSANYPTTNQSYKHLSEAERGEIEAYLSVGLKPAEIARRLGRNRSTITREINRGSVTQVKQVNGQKVYYQHYYMEFRIILQLVCIGINFQCNTLTRLEGVASISKNRINKPDCK